TGRLLALRKSGAATFSKGKRAEDGPRFHSEKSAHLPRKVSFPTYMPPEMTESYFIPPSADDGTPCRRAFGQIAGARPGGCFRVLQVKVLVFQRAAIRLGRAGRDPLEGVAPKRPAVGGTGHDAFLVTHHLLLIQGTAAGAVGTAGFHI